VRGWGARRAVAVRPLHAQSVPAMRQRARPIKMAAGVASKRRDSPASLAKFQRVANDTGIAHNSAEGRRRPSFIGRRLLEAFPCGWCASGFEVSGGGVPSSGVDSHEHWPLGAYFFSRGFPTARVTSEPATSVLNRPGFPRGSQSWESGSHGTSEQVFPRGSRTSSAHGALEAARTRGLRAAARQ
jgi:hypothetical protein